MNIQQSFIYSYMLVMFPQCFYCFVCLVHVFTLNALYLCFSFNAIQYIAMERAMVTT